MTVALAMTACSSDDNSTETPQAPSTSKIIDYTVTVNDGAATTRATVDSDNKTLKFAEGDKLYITGTNIKGVLNIQTGATTNSATFSGDLTFSGSGTPASDLSLTATLVSAHQTDGSEVSINSTTGAVTVNYPTTAYCASVNDAVQKYSNLTGTSTYGTKSFTLNQQTAFLNFVITFTDGTVTNTALSAVVNNNNSDICTATVTTVTDNGIKAKFVLPVAKGTTLNSATVKMGDKHAIIFGASQTLEGKVYNVKKTQATYTMAVNAVAADVGKLICTDGHIHPNNSDESCTAAHVAKIIYVGSATDNATYTHGLALALTNEGQDESKYYADVYCSNKTTVANAIWTLPSKNQWETMIAAAGGYAALRGGFSSVGGTNLVADYYWSSTQGTKGSTWWWSINFSDGNWAEDSAYSKYVRACLVF